MSVATAPATRLAGYSAIGTLALDMQLWDIMVDGLRAEGLQITDDLSPIRVDADGTEWYETEPYRS